MTHLRDASALMGALVADAAALGLHWLYDPERIAAVTEGRDAAFYPLGDAAYDGAMGIFVHQARENGALSQYGETLALTMRSIEAQGGFDTPAFQKAYAAHFGPGGSYAGYIDRPTRGTLENLAAEQSAPSGVEDDQHPAISTLPAIVARYLGSSALDDMRRNAMQVTNLGSTAESYSAAICQALSNVITGTPLKGALTSAATGLAPLEAALTTTQTDPVAYGHVTERACHLPQGAPLSFHILANTTSYREAVEANIRAGGDSCGRAIIIGALAGAAYGADRIPLDWTLSLQDAANLWTSAQSVAALNPNAVSPRDKNAH